MSLRLVHARGVDALGQTLRTVSQRPKVVLFIGTYVRTFEGDAADAGPPAIPGQITPSFSTMPGMTECPARLRDARRAFERAMGEANVTVHVLDPVGIDTEASTPLGPDACASAWTRCRSSPT